MDPFASSLVAAALVALLVVLPTAALNITEEALAASVPSAYLVTKAVNYSADVPLTGYLAYDKRITSPRPGLVVFPDWDGIGGYEQYRAKMLAQLGYIVLVGDLYGSDVIQGPSLSLDERAALLLELINHPATFRGRMVAALATLRGLPHVATTRLAAVGYCLGGTGIIELARAYPNGTAGLDCVVGLHAGKLDTVGSTIAPHAPIKILLLQGANDTTVLGRQNFTAEMDAADIDYKIVDYPSSFHAYTEPSTAAYNPQADKLSWAAMRLFLNQTLGSETPFDENATQGAVSVKKNATTTA